MGLKRKDINDRICRQGHLSLGHIFVHFCSAHQKVGIYILVERMGKAFGARALRLGGPVLLFLLWQHIGLAVAQVCTKNGKLCDRHERCQAWKDDGECVRSQSYMRKHCPASCEGVREEVKEAGIAADQGDCKDMHEHCSLWAKLGECSETDAMLKYCALSCGVCEPDEDEACKDEHENCAFWQSHGKIRR
jgi:ShK domain-like